MPVPYTSLNSATKVAEVIATEVHLDMPHVQPPAIAFADTLYQAKSRGRHRYCVCWGNA
ncbi:hypothetical protein [Chroococcidiopsis sp. TS-821]|uniref:hypothetical protein n=1 Tax=Chroococcidiopsis sp. TS-821 TaxID=1378066 RepID=UPI00143DD3AE|nr:hypothetical protein [Chroococcidiopsis sp. TS-821]